MRQVIERTANHEAWDRLVATVKHNVHEKRPGLQTSKMFEQSSERCSQYTCNHKSRLDKTL